MISIKQEPINREDYTRLVSNKNQVRSEKGQYDSSYLSNTLRALALVGLSTIMTSCYTDSVDDDYIRPQVPTEETVTPSTPIAPSDSVSCPECVSERMDNILNSLGLLKSDTASIKNIETISCSDSEGHTNWIKPGKINDYIMSGEGLILTYDDSEYAKYSYIAKNANNGGVNVIRTYKDGSVEIQNYKSNSNGSVTEYDIVGNTMLEKAKYEKQDDGTIIKTLNNGYEIIYDKIKNNVKYPTPI